MADRGRVKGDEAVEQEMTDFFGKLVVVESPLRGDYEANIAYARKCLGDCLKKGEAPFASHLLYPGTLDGTVPDQRMLGMTAGWAIAEKMNYTVVYLDRGVTQGMILGMQRSRTDDRPVVFRMFGDLAEAVDVSWERAKDVSPELGDLIAEWENS